MKLGILDYKACNIGSVKSSLYRLGIDPIIVDKPEQIPMMDKLIIPGVGSAKNCINFLKNNSFVEPIINFLKKKTILGICLGMQIFLTKLHEDGISDGLNIVEGEVLPLSIDKKKFNIGWGELKLYNSHDFIKIDDLSSFYYCHSYYVSLKDKTSCFATIDVNKKIPAIILKNNFIGTQFHPEKSQTNGKEFLKLFLNWKKN
jgi:glutamine amidotransferase